MDPIQDIPNISNSIWPHETGNAPETSPSSQFDKLRCFVLCPFTRAEIVLFLAKQSATNLGKLIKHEIDVYYAGDISGPGAIQPSIWAHIKQADIILVDVTNYNPNVLYELGVAASWRPIESVIIIRDESDLNPVAFDIQPARQRIYDSRKLGWITQMVNLLSMDMWHCLSQIPFKEEPILNTKLPILAQLTDGIDNKYLWSPGPTHRRLSNEGLEFGSPYFFPYSWLSPSGIRLKNVRVKAEMAFSDFIKPDYWIGIALRSQGFMANKEHLVWLSQSGKVMRTGPGLDSLDMDEHEVGQLINKTGVHEFTEFDITMDEVGWSIKVGNVQRVIQRNVLPHIFCEGRIMFQSYLCRAIVKNIEIYAVD